MTINLMNFHGIAAYNQEVYLRSLAQIEEQKKQENVALYDLAQALVNGTISEEEANMTTGEATALIGAIEEENIQNEIESNKEAWFSTPEARIAFVSDFINKLRAFMNSSKIDFDVLETRLQRLFFISKFDYSAANRLEKSAKLDDLISYYESKTGTGSGTSADPLEDFASSIAAIDILKKIFSITGVHKYQTIDEVLSNAFPSYPAYHNQVNSFIYEVINPLASFGEKRDVYGTLGYCAGLMEYDNNDVPIDTVVTQGGQSLYQFGHLCDFPSPDINALETYGHQVRQHDIWGVPQNTALHELLKCSTALFRSDQYDSNGNLIVYAFRSTISPGVYGDKLKFFDSSGNVSMKELMPKCADGLSRKKKAFSLTSDEVDDWPILHAVLLSYRHPSGDHDVLPDHQISDAVFNIKTYLLENSEFEVISGLSGNDGKFLDLVTDILNLLDDDSKCKKALNYKLPNDLAVEALSYPDYKPGLNSENIQFCVLEFIKNSTWHELLNVVPSHDSGMFVFTNYHITGWGSVTSSNLDAGLHHNIKKKLTEFIANKCNNLIPFTTGSGDPCVENIISVINHVFHETTGCGQNKNVEYQPSPFCYSSIINLISDFVNSGNDPVTVSVDLF